MKTLLFLSPGAPEYLGEVVRLFQLIFLENNSGVKVFGGHPDGTTFTVGDDYQIISRKLPCADATVIIDVPPPELLNQKRLVRIARKTSGKILNPSAASRRADDKAFTLSIWAKAGFQTPVFLFLKRGKHPTYRKILHFIRKHRLSSFYLQANSLTEGRETYFFQADYFMAGKEFFEKTLVRLLEIDDFLVKEPRGNLFLKKDNEFLSVVFRLAVFWSGTEWCADYGFVQVAPAGSPVTSVEKGGRILEFQDTLKNLYYREDSRFYPVQISSSSRQEIKEKIIESLEIFNGRIKKEKILFAGIDFLLETKGGKLIPVLLEINPRCAGLNRLSRW